MEDKISDFEQADYYKKLYLKQKKMQIAYSFFFFFLGFFIAAIICSIGIWAD